MGKSKTVSGIHVPESYLMGPCIQTIHKWLSKSLDVDIKLIDYAFLEDSLMSGQCLYHIVYVYIAVFLERCSQEFLRGGGWEPRPNLRTSKLLHSSIVLPVYGQRGKLFT